MLSSRENLFTRLAALLDSGITIGEALDMLAKSESGATARALEAARSAISAGGSLEEGLEASGLFEEVEIALIVAGETSGQLPGTFRRLASEDGRRRKRWQAAVVGLAYPVLVFHLAAILPNLRFLFTKGKGLYTFLLYSGGTLAAAYALVLVPLAIWKILSRSPVGAAKLDRVLLALPVVGRAILARQLARALNVLEGLTSAGVTFISALEPAIKVTSSPALREALVRIRRRLIDGESVAGATAQEPILPREVLELIATGERSGQLDQMLARSRDILEIQAENRIRVLLMGLTGLIFGAVALFVGWTVISFFMDYIEKINSIR